MIRKRIAWPMAALAAVPAASSVNAANKIADPLSFFAGTTESISTIKVVMKRPFKSRSIGHGRILPDRTLDLVQRVEDEGQPPHNRRWRIRQVGPGKFSGTMTEAVGPVTVEERPEGYLFRFKMKGNVAVEQWMTPIAGGTAARNRVTVRKFGMTVARSEGTIRKTD